MSKIKSSATPATLQPLGHDVWLVAEVSETQTEASIITEVRSSVRGGAARCGHLPGSLQPAWPRDWSSPPKADSSDACRLESRVYQAARLPPPRPRHPCASWTPSTMRPCGWQDPKKPDPCVTTRRRATCRGKAPPGATTRSRNKLRLRLSYGSCFGVLATAI